MFRSIAILAVLAAVTCWASVLPGPPPLKPKAINVDQPDFQSIPKEQFKLVVEENAKPPMTERYPGYTRGSQPTDADCGRPGVQTFITGGQETAPHAYPWMAALFFDMNGGTYFCGGTLISDQWVMTAAHCVADADSMKVMLGAHNVREGFEEGREEFQIEDGDWFAHPNWNSLLIRNDIGLIKLPEPINFTEIIRPVCLPSYSDVDDNFASLDAPASGWGKPTDAADSISPVLRDVTTRTITNLVCFFELFQITSANICISGAGGKSTCNGDSGGPLHKVMDDGRLKQIGITSFGSSLGCELGIHAAFTRPTSYLEFIETETGIQIDP